jgi:NADH:ubiquinone oxidoreductase subunit 5 (subunit L)/multisubunit Na+/H+ antiporter MnhA subunit
MKALDFQSSSQSVDWMIFVGLLVAMAIPVFCFVIWLLLFRQPGKKRSKHRKHRHHRPLNPTLAQTGGLPPVRRSDEPPHGV